MKKIIFVSVVFLSQCVFGQELMNLVSNNEVSVISYWNNEERVSFTCTKVEKVYKNGKKKPKTEKTKKYKLALSIIDSTEHSYTIQMTYSDFSGIENEQEEMCNSALTQLSIKYVTDEFGAYDSIVNKNELQASMKQVIDALYKTVSDTSSIGHLRDLFLNEDNLEALFVSDIITIHNFYGVGLELSKPIDYELEFLTLGNYMLEGEGKITLLSIDKTRDLARISSTQKPNKGKTGEYLNYLMNLLAPGEEIDDFKVSNRVTQSYEMELSSGWMTKIKSKSVSKVNYDGKSIKTEIVNTFILN
ncbi:MAG: hypothetical protein COA33_014490 [Fluviicola sp.]|nr:hypothetical protein [Fluviicola sp.]